MRNALMTVVLLAATLGLGCAAKPKTYSSSDLMRLDSGWSVVRPGTRIVLDGSVRSKCDMKVGSSPEDAERTGSDIAELAWTRTAKVWEVVDFKATGGADAPDVVYLEVQEAGGGSSFWLATTARTPPCMFLE